MKKKYFLPVILLLTVCFAPYSVDSQEVKSFSLKDAQQYAVEYNYDVINSRTDVEIAKRTVKENTALGLPQINGTINYNNNLKLRTTLMPGEFFGQPGEDIPVQFGTQHTGDVGATVSQLIFSGKYIVGLMTAKAFVDLRADGVVKSEIEIKNIIAKSYYPVIILQENKKVFDSTLATLQNMLVETEAYYKSGFLEDTDVDQIELMISDIEATITNINNQLSIAKNMLKYQMGVEATVEIVVTDKLAEILAVVNRQYLLESPFDIQKNIDYKLLKDQEKFSGLKLRLQKTEYLPTLSAVYSYQQSAMRDDFNFFVSGRDWYESQMLGISLQVPIFSSGNRSNKVQKAKLEIEKLMVKDSQLKQGLAIKVETARSVFDNAYLIYLNKKKSVEQAQKIYNKTQIKYKSGMASSLNLSQTYNQFLVSQIQYLTSILDLLNKKADLEMILTRVE
jgi:outer membrane protein TolC